MRSASPGMRRHGAEAKGKQLQRCSSNAWTAATLVTRAQQGAARDSKGRSPPCDRGGAP